MKALFSKQALTFALALTVSLVGLNVVHAIVIQSQNGNVADEQAIAEEMAYLDKLAADKAAADKVAADAKAAADKAAADAKAAADKVAADAKAAADAHMAPFTKPEKVSLDMQQQTLLSPQRQLKARTPNCT